MKKHIPINRILLALLVAISAVLVIFTYLYAFHENPPIEFNNLPFPTDKPEYSIGDDIILTSDYCRYTNVPYIVNMRFVDGLVFNIPEVHRTGASVECNTVDFQILKVPENLPPGTYYLHGKNEYEVNFLSTRVVEWTSQEFEIMP